MSKLGTVILLLVLIFEACNSNSNSNDSSNTKQKQDSISLTEIPADSINPVIKSIINISATDFSKNQNPVPVAFREVELKYSIKPNKEVLFILCGEFTSDNNNWIHFTTIKNSDYEQWIGPNGLTYCENSIAINCDKTKLATDLLTELNELKKK